MTPRRGVSAGRADAGPAGGLDLSGMVFNGQRSQSVAFVVLRMDAGDDLTFAISVDGRGRESWRWGCRLTSCWTKDAAGRRVAEVEEALGCQPAAKRDCTRRATWRK